MRRFLTGLLLAATAGTASAHTLGPDDGLIAQLEHELLGLHHVPLTLLLVVVGIVAYRRLSARKKS